jgi:hypothetical protein
VNCRAATDDRSELGRRRRRIVVVHDHPDDGGRILPAEVIEHGAHVVAREGTEAHGPAPKNRVMLSRWWAVTLASVVLDRQFSLEAIRGRP